MRITPNLPTLPTPMEKPTANKDSSSEPQTPIQDSGQTMPTEKQQQASLIRSRSADARTLSKIFENSKDTELTEKFASTQPARGKVKNNVQRSPIQADERKPLQNGDWETRINPTRIMVMNGKITKHDGTQVSGDLSKHLPLDKLREGKVSVKWDISNNGTLVIGETKVSVNDENATGKTKLKLGHPTLVGGVKIPHARISGMLFANEKGDLMINNDSGRFSEYEDRKPEHLNAVADIFRQHNLPVETEWMQKKPIPLKN